MNFLGRRSFRARLPAMLWAFAFGMGLFLPIAWGQTSTSPKEPRKALDPSDMDPTAAACTDFNAYANGGWLKKNPTPPEFSRWGTFSELTDRNRQALRAILERLAHEKNSPGSDEQKLGDFYASCMDESAVEAAGARPIEPELARIEKIANIADLEAEVARLQARGVTALFVFGAQQDRKNSSEVIAGVAQGGLGLPDRDYYTKTDEKSQKIRDDYREHLAKMFELLGDAREKAQAEAKTVLMIESGLAEASMTRVERRDPDATYHRLEVSQLKSLTPSFPWTSYLRDIEAPTIASLNVAQPKFFEALNTEISRVSLPDWKTYLRWHLVHWAAPRLSPRFVEENFAFFSKTLEGTQEIQPRWKRCVQATDAQLGFALGRLYVREYFPPEAKERADRMVQNLIAALRDDLATLPWMGEATRKEALEKLNAFTPKIGYPDKWRDYSSFAVDRGPYVVNALNGNIYETRRDVRKIGKPVDRTEWGMTPPTVNAYYSAPRNEIVFPAGILQPPFFNKNADDAVNYGGIGAVIGHEMTHGFDDQGRKSDAAGNLRNWWTQEDLKNYEARSACVEKQFDGYVVQGDLHENGKLVLGESIADLGGLTIAYRAYQKSLEGKQRPAPIDGLEPEQRFFLSFAHVWAENIRPEAERLMVTVNPHPLDRFRAIAAPSNMPEFQKAFGCKAEDPMVRSERCQIW